VFILLNTLLNKLQQFFLKKCIAHKKIIANTARLRVFMEKKLSGGDSRYFFFACFFIRKRPGLL